jgi:hypothetical protein
MQDLIICTKCNMPKKESEFWFDKRRGTVRKPCRECSSRRSSLTNKVRYANSFITRSDVLNHYKAKGLSEDILIFFTDLIILNRAIKKMEKPLVKSDGICTYIFCPTCGDFESVELPCELQNLIEISTIFTELHKHNDI